MDDNPPAVDDDPETVRLKSLMRSLLSGTQQQKRIAEAAGVSAGALKDYAAGKSLPPIHKFVRIATALGIDPGQFFSPERAARKSQSDVVRIPVLDVAAAAGPGRNADVVRAVDELPVPLQFVQRLAPPDADLSCLRAAGDSMAPTILDGAIVIIDGHQKKPQPWRPVPRKTPSPRQPHDDIFVFNQSGDLRLKRLRDIGEGFLAIISDNHAENPIEIFKFGRDGGLAVIGKVIWWDNRL